MFILLFLCFLGISNHAYTSSQNPSFTDTIPTTQAYNYEANIIFRAITFPLTAIKDEFTLTLFNNIDNTFGTYGLNLETTEIDLIKKTYLYLIFLAKRDKVLSDPLYRQFQSDFAKYLETNNQQMPHIPNEELISSAAWQAIKITNSDLISSQPWQYFCKSMVCDSYVYFYTVLNIIHNVELQTFNYIPNIETSYYDKDYTDMRTINEISRIKLILESRTKQYFAAQCSDWANLPNIDPNNKDLKKSTTIEQAIIQFRQTSFYKKTHNMKELIGAQDSQVVSSQHFINPQQLSSPLREQVWCFFMLKEIMTMTFGLMNQHTLELVLETCSSTDIFPNFFPYTLDDYPYFDELIAVKCKTENNHTKSIHPSPQIYKYEDTHLLTTYAHHQKQKSNTNSATQKKLSTSDTLKKSDVQMQWFGSSWFHAISHAVSHAFNVVKHGVEDAVHAVANSQVFKSVVGFGSKVLHDVEKIPIVGKGVKDIAQGVEDSYKVLKHGVSGLYQEGKGLLEISAGAIFDDKSLKQEGFSDQQTALQDLQESKKSFELAATDFAQGLEEGVLAPTAYLTGSLLQVVFDDQQLGQSISNTLNSVTNTVMTAIEQINNVMIEAVAEGSIVIVQASTVLSNIIVTAVLATVSGHTNELSGDSDFWQNNLNILKLTLSSITESINGILAMSKQAIFSMLTALGAIMNAMDSLIVEVTRELTFVLGSIFTLGLDEKNITEARNKTTNYLNAHRSTVVQAIGVVVSIGVDVAVAAATGGVGSGADAVITMAIEGAAEAAAESSADLAAKEAAEEAAKEAADEAVKEAAKEGASNETKEAAEIATKKAEQATEQVVEAKSKKDLADKALDEAKQQALKKVALHNAEKTSIDAEKKAGKIFAKTSDKEAASQARAGLKQAAENELKATTKSEAEAISEKDVADNAVKEAEAKIENSASKEAKQAAQKELNETKQAAQKAAQNLAKKTGDKTVAENLLKKASKKAVTETEEVIAKKSAEETSKDIEKQIEKKAQELLNNKISQQAAKKSAEIIANKGATEAEREAAQKALKELAQQGRIATQQAAENELKSVTKDVNDATVNLAKKQLKLALYDSDQEAATKAINEAVTKTGEKTAKEWLTESEEESAAKGLRKALKTAREAEKEAAEKFAQEAAEKASKLTNEAATEVAQAAKKEAQIAAENATKAAQNASDEAINKAVKDEIENEMKEVAKNQAKRSEENILKRQLTKRALKKSLQNSIKNAEKDLADKEFAKVTAKKALSKATKQVLQYSAQTAAKNTSKAETEQLVAKNTVHEALEHEAKVMADETASDIEKESAQKTAQDAQKELEEKTEELANKQTEQKAAKDALEEAGWQSLKDDARYSGKVALRKLAEKASSILLNSAFGTFSIMSGMNSDARNSHLEEQQYTALKKLWKYINETKLSSTQSQLENIHEIQAKQKAEVGNKTMSLAFYKNIMHKKINTFADKLATILAKEYTNILTPDEHNMLPANIGTSWGLQTNYLDIYPSEGFSTATTGRTDFPFAQEVAQAPLAAIPSKTTSNQSPKTLNKGKEQTKLWFNQKVISLDNMDSTGKAKSPNDILNVSIDLQILYTLNSGFHTGLYLGGSYYDYNSTSFLKNIQNSQKADLDTAYLAKMVVLFKESTDDPLQIGIYEHEGRGWIFKQTLPKSMQLDMPHTYHLRASLAGTSLQIKVSVDNNQEIVIPRSVTNFDVTQINNQRTYGVIASGVAIQWNQLTPKPFLLNNKTARPKTQQISEIEREKASKKRFTKLTKPKFGSMKLTPLSKQAILFGQYLYITTDTDIAKINPKNPIDYILFATYENNQISNIGAAPTPINTTTTTPNVVVSVITGHVYNNKGNIIAYVQNTWDSYNKNYGPFDEKTITYITSLQKLINQKLSHITFGSFDLDIIDNQSLKKGQFIYKCNQTMGIKDSTGKLIPDYLITVELNNNTIGNMIGMPPTSNNANGLVSLVTGNTYIKNTTLISDEPAPSIVNQPELGAYESQFGTITSSSMQKIQTSQQAYRSHISSTKKALLAQKTAVISFGSSDATNNIASYISPSNGLTLNPDGITLGIPSSGNISNLQNMAAHPVGLQLGSPQTGITLTLPTP